MSEATDPRPGPADSALAAGGAGLLVAGVGRSGTSVATRLAMTLGLRGPESADVMPANAANPSGYWESNSLAILNDDLLGRLGATWWTPPHELNESDLALLAPMEATAAQAFAAVFGHGPGWVWKDPRLTVLLPFWSRVLGDQPVLVPIRAPQAVARSISARDGIPYEAALDVWAGHTRCLLTSLTGRRVLVVRYESLLTQPQVWVQDVLQFLRSAGLPVTPIEGDVELTAPRQQDEAPLPTTHQRLYDVVLGLAGLHERFPALELPPMSRVVAPAFDLGRVMAGSAPRSTPTQLDNLGALATTLTEERELLHADHQRIVDERGILIAELATAQQQLRDADAALRELMGQRDDALQAVDELGTRVQALSAQLDHQRSVADNAARERDEYGMRLIDAEQRSAGQPRMAGSDDREALRQRLSQVDEELLQIRRTLSWRVTRPLRFLRTVVSRRGGR